MTLTSPMKIALALVAIMLFGFGFYLTDWQAKYAELQSVQQNLNDQRGKLANNRELVKDLATLTKQKADLEAKLNQVVQTNLVPEKAELFVANYIREVEKLVLEERERMADPDFEVLSITPGVLTEQSPGGAGEEDLAAAGEGAEAADGAGPDALKSFPTRVFQMSMKGRYTTLIDFLYQLGALRLERLVTINKISLAPAENLDKPGSPALSITIPITAYMRQGG